ncbi:alpha/beta fold hydrolase [Streptomyces griseiscabiei]|uniref:Alpha/beta hydrolase n=1 Tax=Streptomyces griseiscabiei TaxID=2993540 RepID=A0ABU4LDQ1_9ACTN|nr:alpha/beta hydrolase [Streptomyces griseiscabiei]MBZ3906659.1 alpha/beta hydrolase [Streptomyces griseiscabiei]MDX2913723.1 alpha/beta hydrolase [Streptomyces griseiscabiei]
MPWAKANGVELFYKTAGSGDPLVLVHGSWGDHHNWIPVLPALTERFRVLVYDRRGHSRSERPPGQGTRREDEEDLAALMETLGFAPAYVAGNSFGASTTLGLATHRPDLFLGLVAHDPPLTGIVGDGPDGPDGHGGPGTLDPRPPLLTDIAGKFASVLAHLRAGDYPAAARQFTDEIALGPGTWDRLPPPVRQTFLANAPTFLDEHDDPHWDDLDLPRLAAYTGPALLTGGTAGLPWFAPITARLTEALPQAATHTFEGAGHIPHVTHPEAYARAVTAFVEGTGTAHGSVSRS